MGEASRIIVHQMLRAYGVGNETRGYQMKAARQIYLAIFVICLAVFELDAAAFADARLDSSGSSVVPACAKAIESPATERDDLVAEQIDWKALA